MMIRTAGGPAVSPLDFNERKQPLPKSAWIAIGVVAAAHVAVGIGLYYQRFEAAAQPPIDDGPIIILQNPPKPIPLPKPVPPRPSAANTAIHETPAPTTATDTVAAVHDDTPNPGPGISIAETVPDPTPAAEPAMAQPTPPAVITNPSWLSQPNADQMGRAYPDRALSRSIAGSATLNCAVHANGSVGECAVTRETPGGYGFGRAAQGLSRYFRINPRTVNGAAVDARVDINLRFNPPRD